jgi:hypothetical protein
MRLNLFNISRTTSTLGFLTLFPGFVLYHYSVAQGWIPPFLGGLFGSVAALLAVFALLLSPWLAAEGFVGALVPASVVAITVGYIAAWAIANYLFLRGEPYGAAAEWEALSALGGWIAMIFVGGCYAFDARMGRRALVWASALIILALVHAMYRFRSPLGPYLTFSGDDQDVGVASYQGVGRSIVVTAIFLAAGMRTTRRRLGVLAGAGFFLVLLGSRTDLFTVLAIIVAVLALTVLRGRLIATMGVLLACYVAYVVIAPLFLETRNAEIFDLANSSSWQARHELEVIALGVIHQHPILGDFGYQQRIGGSGFYAHNALSAWTNYGLLGFGLYIGLILYFLLASLRRLMRSPLADPATVAAFHLNLAALIQTVATPVFTPLPALGWGVALNAMRRAEIRERSVVADATPAVL